MNIKAWFQYFSMHDNFQAHYNLRKKGRDVFYMIVEELEFLDSFNVGKIWKRDVIIIVRFHLIRGIDKSWMFSVVILLTL